MLIKQIELENFRQFYGTHKLEFATDPQKNVTLIHAENTFGKTTILNAVLWTFFEIVTSKFEKPEKILNFDAKDEGATQASVSVLFEFKNEIYSVKRTFDQNPQGRNGTKLYAYKVTKGNFEPLQAPETFIGSVIPKEMAKYFFFDGEAAEAYSSTKNYQAVAEAIRNILGCFLAERAIGDLKELSKEIDQDMAGVSSDGEIKRLEERLSALSTSIDEYEILKDTTKDTISTYKEQLSAIEAELREMEGSKELQKLRESKGEQLKLINAGIQECEVNIVQWIGNNTTALVSERLSSQSLDFIDEASLRGRIPSPYDEDFVSKLLNDKVCVCKRELIPESKEWEAVASLLKTATNKEILDRVVRARAYIRALKDGRREAPAILIKSQKKLASQSGMRDKLEQEIKELGEKLEGLPVKEIAEKENARRSLQKMLEQKHVELGAIRAKIGELKADYESVNREFEKKAIKDESTKKLVIRKQLVEQSAGILRVALSRYEKEAREDIEKQTNEILTKVTHNHRKCRIGDNFSIELLKDDGVSCPKSSGENQLLSLVFISSLIQFASSRADDDNILLKPGTVAPLVLDSPFGQLDKDYQEDAARNIPALAPQVILLVSSSQGNPKVLDAIESRVGMEYVLVAEYKAPVGSKKEAKLLRHGKEIPMSYYSQKHDLTRIERV
jgi:DNA sulfur modification protein DndD